MNQNLIQSITDEDKNKIRQIFEIDDEEKLRDGVVALAEWCSKQNHFVEKNLSNFFLEKSLVLNKGSVEKVKVWIDRVLFTRGVLQDLVLKRTPEEMKRISQHLAVVPLPKLNPLDETRVTVFQFLTTNIDDINMMALFRLGVLVTEYRHTFDYALAERLVYDFKNYNLSILTKLTPAVVKKIEILAVKAYGLKFKGLHLINAPPYVEKLVFLLKHLLRGKITERIHVHSSYEDLHKHVCREVLPEDYGGEEQPLSKLHAQWIEELSSPAMAEYCITSDRLKTDESKRINSSPFTEEYLGISGNFRQLSVD